MDTLTHIVAGACIGSAIGGRQLGKKALFLGALAQSLPDIDFTASFWLSTSCDLLAHRGFTHSFLFIIIVTPILVWLSSGSFKKAGMSTGHWALFWGLQVFIHVFIDAFNAYGTGWFEPFSHYRVSFNTMYVADPFFSMWPGISFIALLLLRKDSVKRKLWISIGLGLSSLYLLLGIAFKFYIEAMVKKELDKQQIVSKRHISTPTPFNNMLWYIVAENDSGYSIGYRSVFDTKDKIDFHFVPKNDSLLKAATYKEDVANLVRFSQGYYTVDKWHDTLVFNDLRFGEILGWAEPKPKFVFYYFLDQPKNNKVIVQRGRFARWDKAALMAFIKRIGGV
jgi:inner membrane protein